MGDAAITIRVAHIPGKGRGFVAARPLKGGEVVLRDSPILIYDADADDNINTTNSIDDVSVQSRFLLAAYSLRTRSPHHFSTLLSLQGSPDTHTDSAAEAIHRVFSSHLNSEDVRLSSALLAKDKLNAFGLMHCPSPLGQRRVRSYAIYPNASSFNHDCLPNACRFDYLETGSSDMTVRMIHDVPVGAEVCLSYFPVNVDFRARQQRLRDDYGFTCTCDRCNVEAQWPHSDADADDDAADADADDDMVDAMDDDVDDDGDDNEEDDGDSFPHAYFFARYMCQLPNCGGTLAPTSTTPSDSNCVTMECNVCANLTSLQN